MSRVFGGLENRGTGIGNLHPNVALYQTEPHLVDDFSLFSVSGQTCGQTTYIGVVIELIIAQKCNVFKGFRRFCKFYVRNRQFAPETGALPPALHLVTLIL